MQEGTQADTGTLCIPGSAHTESQSLFSMQGKKEIIYKLFMSTKIRASICGFYKPPTVWDHGFPSLKNGYTYITCSWEYESELEALQGSLPTLSVLRFGG